MNGRKVRKIDINSINRFKPKLYADLYIPSWVNGYSIATEFVYNWFLSKLPNNFFKTIHIAGKHGFDDFRRFEVGDFAKRERPAVSFNGQVQADFDDDYRDIHMVGIDRFIMRTDYQKSFFKDEVKGRFLGMVPEQILTNFEIRCKVSTRAQQMDLYKRLEIACRIGCTETFDTDLDYHVPYDLMIKMAKDTGFGVIDDVIVDPYSFLRYLNSYSQIPFMYKLRYINGKREFFIRMRNIPIYMDMKNKMSIDDGEQDGQTSRSYHIEMSVSIKVPVPKFFVYYAEGKLVNSIEAVEPEDGDISIYSMKVFDIPEVNEKGWVQFATSNYLADKDQQEVKEIDISELFKAPIDTKINTSLDNLIQDSLDIYISPSRFIDIAIYTNDMMINSKIPIKIDWKNRKIILVDRTRNSYFYIAIYIDRLYMNERILEINRSYDNRVKIADKKYVDHYPKETHRFEPIIEENKKEIF